MKDKERRSLAVQINDIAYDIKGTNVDDHVDYYAKKGCCNSIMVANLKENIKENTLVSESFSVQKN